MSPVLIMKSATRSSAHPNTGVTPRRHKNQRPAEGRALVEVRQRIWHLFAKSLSIELVRDHPENMAVANIHVLGPLCQIGEHAIEVLASLADDPVRDFVEAIFGFFRIDVSGVLV